MSVAEVYCDGCDQRAVFAYQLDPSGRSRRKVLCLPCALETKRPLAELDVEIFSTDVLV